MLASAGCSLHSLEVVPSGWYASRCVREFHSRAHIVLQEEFGDSQLFMLSDPRFCLLLPFWLDAMDAFGARVRIIFVVGNSADVVIPTPETNNSMTSHIGYYVWLRHMLVAEAASRSRRRAFVCYEDMASDVHAKMDQLGRMFGISWSGFESPEVSKRLSGCLQAEISSRIGGRRSSLLDIPPVAESFFSLFRRWCSGEVYEADTEVLETMNLCLDEVLFFHAECVMKASGSGVVAECGGAGYEKQAADPPGSTCASNIWPLGERRSQRVGAWMVWHFLAVVCVPVLWLARRLPVRWRGVVVPILARYTPRLIRILYSVRETYQGNVGTTVTVGGIRYRKMGIWMVWHFLVVVHVPVRWLARRLPVEWRMDIIRILARHTPWLMSMLHSIRGVGVASDTVAICSFCRLFYQRRLRLRAADISTTASGMSVEETQGVAVETRTGLFQGNGFPRSMSPLVSIIIPVYGHLDQTLRCLRSVMTHWPKIPCEIIVVDDGSEDNTSQVLGSVPGLRLLSKRKNEGFICACNHGAALANGKYLHFLNNDTEVLSGWLVALLRTFEDFPGAGLVGSKLLYPNGMLQEAGCIIWSNGGAGNIGRYQDASKPGYNYACEVDYCSGASLMLEKTLFDELGGFDEHYRPAYCEDVDLALKVHDRGLQVIYQPLSVVVHHEGVTSGTNTVFGRTKAYQIANTSKLHERWKERLMEHCVYGESINVVKDRKSGYRALVLDSCTPEPDKDAGSVLAMNLMLLLRRMGFQLTFIPVDNYLYVSSYTVGLQRAGIEALYAPYCISVGQHVRECGNRYDLVFMIRPSTVRQHIQAVRQYCPRAKVVYETSDIHYLRMQREAVLFGDAVREKAAAKMKQMELANIAAVDATLVCSFFERDMLSREMPVSHVHVQPLVADNFGRKGLMCGRSGLVYLGGFRHPPNVDAVRFFVHDIMPLLREQLPGVRFHVVGSRVPDEIQALAADDILIEGFVSDLEPLFSRMRVAVVPLRYGAGAKGKIVTSMGAGVPVVTTSVGAEGMGLTDRQNVLIADGNEAFACAVAQVYEDEELWMRLSDSGLEFSHRTWGTEAGLANLSRILAGLGLDRLRHHDDLPLRPCSTKMAMP